MCGMTMAEQNGIDILCDAAGSDLLLSSYFGLGTPAGAPAHAPASTQPVVKRVKVSDNDAFSLSPGAAPGSDNVCYICKRVYERADHLTRHMRSHENARPYACSRCPKRFNRADLLTRHESTHDRDGDGKTRTVKRSDRAAEACLNCAAAKAKCDDQKPCGRCRTKSLPCHASSRRPSAYKTLDDHPALSPSDNSSHASGSRTEDGYGYAVSNGAPYAHGRNVTSAYASNPGGVLGGAPYLNNSEFQPGVLLDGMSDDLTYFNPIHSYFQDIDFTSFDLNFDSFVIPPIDAVGPSPQSTATSSRALGHHAVKDASRRHAAFRRSPWLWEPESKDYVSSEKRALHVNEESINNAATFDKLCDSNKPARWPKMGVATRDKLFAMILSEHKDPSRVPSFPSLDLLNYLLHADLTHGDRMRGDFFHSPTFDPEDTLTELLASVIASGATFISVPAIWQFGYAMQEIVRQRIERLFESKNSNTRNLKCIQTYMLQLDIGIWSGFKRKTELAESFLQPLVTMVRRAGVLSTAGEPLSLLPTASDSPEVLEVKWQKFIHRESYKRLALHIFIHDVQASVSLQKSPLMSFTELAFTLPAARDLWKAPSAKAWRDTYLRKTPLHPSTAIPTAVPRVADLMHRLRAADELGEHVDMELCYTAVLHGFWGQISAHREAVRFYQDRPSPNSSHRLWIKTQHQELYRDVVEFAALLYGSRSNVAHLTVVAELFMLTLHVSLDDLQRFAGKLGEDEARRVSGVLEEGRWADTVEARHAVWHAGQVLASARRLAPTSLRRFNAMAVYFAGLALWTYGLLSAAPSNNNMSGDRDVPGREKESVAPSAAANANANADLVLLDGDETRETRAFLQQGRGTPALSHTGTPEPLSNPSNVLSIARGVFRDNFPVRSEPLPPLVDSLENLLRDLGSGPAGRPSRAGSREVAG